MEEPIREAEALTNENDQFIFFTNSIKHIKNCLLEIFLLPR